MRRFYGHLLAFQAGKLVAADCLNRHLITAIAKESGGAVAKCGACDFVNATKNHLTDCCIEALFNGIAAMDRAALLLPFELAFASANPAAGGCAPVAPPRKNEK